VGSAAISIAEHYLSVRDTGAASVTPLSLSDTDPAELAVDAVIVGLHTAEEDSDAPLLAPGAESIAVAFEGRLADTLTLLGASGAPGEVTKLATLGTITAPVIAAVGLGPAPANGNETTAPETLRRAAAAAVRALGGAAKVALALPYPDGDDAGPAMRAIAEGALLGTSRPQPGQRRPVKALSVQVPDANDKKVRAEVKRAVAVARAIARTRDWINRAPNDLRPPTFAADVAEAAAEAGLGVDVLDERALRKGGFGGILAVGMGSEAPPRLVTITYAPKSAARSVALIGKGITFDTGGYAVKPALGMWEMKSDMSGAAAVASTMIALAALRPRVAVTAYIPMAENMISGSAYRPGDVLTMYGGKRVEVINTDAEGRLILADAIARAGEDSPDYLLETSTLTGGQVVALGKRIAGVMGDEALCQRVQAAGERVGEPAWPMPIPDDVRKGMDSDVADISQTNSGMDRAGHMLQGAAFLREFVPEGLPWAHIDIAGPAYHSGEPTGYLTKGGTGVPVRTLLELIDHIATHG
jgi:leucyl aminopeptidase